MKSKLEILAVTLVVVAVASVLLYTPLISAIQSTEDSGIEIFNNENFDACCSRRRLVKARRVWWFLNHSEPEVIDGTVVALFKDMLIVNANDGLVRIHLPPTWTVEEIVTREELYENCLSNSENITIKALRADVIDKAEMSIYFLLGYEISDPVTAYALLPFNIEG